MIKRPTGPSQTMPSGKNPGLEKSSALRKAMQEAKQKREVELKKMEGWNGVNIPQKHVGLAIGYAVGDTGPRFLYTQGYAPCVAVAATGPSVGGVFGLVAHLDSDSETRAGAVIRRLLRRFNLAPTSCIITSDFTDHSSVVMGLSLQQVLGNDYPGLVVQRRVIQGNNERCYADLETGSVNAGAFVFTPAVANYNPASYRQYIVTDVELTPVGIGVVPGPTRVRAAYGDY